MKNKSILLGVNIDHVATLRNARHTRYPDPVQAAFAVENGGADGITVHLREDRRHIKERDIALIQETMQTRLNLEMAVTDVMIKYAERIKPTYCCFVPEKREELTTEGGLNVIAHEAKIRDAVNHLKQCGILVSLFIDPEIEQIEAALRTKAPIIEIHTGAYAEVSHDITKEKELQRIMKAAAFAASQDLIVNAGHGLNYHNVQAIAGIPQIHELNIGHSIIAQALFSGLTHATYTMKRLMIEARN